MSFTDSEKLHLLEELMRTHVFDINWDHVRIPAGRTLFLSQAYLASLRSTCPPDQLQTQVTATLNPNPPAVAPTPTPAQSAPPPMLTTTLAPPPPHSSVLISDTSPLLMNQPPRPSATILAPQIGTPGREGVKRKRGRPRKYPAVDEGVNGSPKVNEDGSPVVKRGRGRPRKSVPGVPVQQVVQPTPEEGSVE